jgi:hypothetical protein
MTENEIRARLAQALRRLSMGAATLAIASCGGSVDEQNQTVDDAGADGSTTGDAQPEDAAPADVVYGAPDAFPPPEDVVDAGPLPPYMAPDAEPPPDDVIDAGPLPPYMAPDAEPPPDDVIDSGPLPPYMGAFGDQEPEPQDEP